MCTVFFLASWTMCWWQSVHSSKYLCLNFHLCFPLILTSLRLLWDSECNLCLSTCQPFFQNNIQPNRDMTPMNVSASSAFYSTWIYHHTWHAATDCGEQTVMLIFVLIILLWYIIWKIDKSILSTTTNFINLIITWYLKLKIKMYIYIYIYIHAFYFELNITHFMPDLCQYWPKHVAFAGEINKMCCGCSMQFSIFKQRCHIRVWLQDHIPKQHVNKPFLSSK